MITIVSQSDTGTGKDDELKRLKEHITEMKIINSHMKEAKKRGKFWGKESRCVQTNPPLLKKIDKTAGFKTFKNNPPSPIYFETLYRTKYCLHTPLGI